MGKSQKGKTHRSPSRIRKKIAAAIKANPDAYKDPNGLNIRQARFVSAYLVDGNGTRSAIAAGYSPNGAEVTAFRLLRNNKIVVALERFKREQAAKLAVVDVSAERIARELALLGFSNAEDFIAADGKPVKNFKGLTRDQMAAVAGAEFDSRGRMRFKLADKRQALVDLGKHLGMFVDRSEVAVVGEVRFVIDGIEVGADK